MAETRRPTSPRLPLRQPLGAESAAELTKDDEAVIRATDKADRSPRLHSDVSGKRLKAVPQFGGTTVVIRSSDFAAHGIKHHDVTFDFRVDKFTLPVGQNGISEEAAEFLISISPGQFKYVNA